MNRNASALSDLGVGQRFPPLAVTVSAAANERYWAAAGADHPLLRDGALYPPIAANLTVMLVQQIVGEALLHTAQTVVSRATEEAGDTLHVTGAVEERFERRGRDYAVVAATVRRASGGVLWESRATFTSTRAPAKDILTPTRTEPREVRTELSPDARHRALHLDAAMLRAYSRAGNFHSDPDEARRLGLPGLVAQGMQVCGPAYAVLLGEWGGDVLARGRLDTRFVGMVVDGQTVHAAVDVDAEHARFDVHDDRGRVVALGEAHRVTRSAEPA